MESEPLIVSIHSGGPIQYPILVGYVSATVSGTGTTFSATLYDSRDPVPMTEFAKIAQRVAKDSLVSGFDENWYQASDGSMWMPVWALESFVPDHVPAEWVEQFREQP